jgi:hypothetical protein
MDTTIINHGVLEGKRETDYVAGALPYEERNSSGDWTQYNPPGERQYNAKADSMSCVTFSALNSIEMQEKLLTGTQPNYSDRWIAKMSGTTKEGNYLYKVADTIRQYGLVLEEDYPTPATYTFEEYHADIPEPLLTELKAKGQEWLKTHSIAYEWIDAYIVSELQKHLKHAPLQVVIPGHAIVEIDNMDSLMKYYDTYEPFIKQRAQNSITSALKIVLTVNNMSNVKILKDENSPLLVIALPITNQEALKSLGMNFGITIPLHADGSVDFDKLHKDGTFKTK